MMMVEEICGLITPRENPDRPGALSGPELVRCLKDPDHRGHHWRDVEPLPEGCPHGLKDAFCHCPTGKVAS